jgi:hypothetical protein
MRAALASIPTIGCLVEVKGRSAGGLTYLDLISNRD